MNTPSFSTASWQQLLDPQLIEAERQRKEAFLDSGYLFHVLMQDIDLGFHGICQDGVPSFRQRQSLFESDKVRGKAF